MALFSAIALALGLYRLLTFYRIFGIDIVNYIEASEILQAQFFALLGIILIVATSCLFIIALMTNEIKFSEPDSINIYLRKYDNFGLYKLGSIFIGAITILFVASGAASSSDAKDLLNDKGLRNVVLIMGNDSIKTNNTLIYVGKTRNYVFLYNRRILQSRILKTDDIKEIKIQRAITSHK